MPGASPLVKLPAGHYVIRPRRHGWHLPDPVGDGELARFQLYASTMKYRVASFEFTDANGTRWQRRDDGLLTEMV